MTSVPNARADQLGELQDIVGAAAERDDDDWYRDAAVAVLAAGYRKPRAITTDDELDALPVGSILFDVDGDVCQRFRGGWRATINERKGDPWLTDTLEVDLPATVLHEPEAGK